MAKGEYSTTEFGTLPECVPRQQASVPARQSVVTGVLATHWVTGTQPNFLLDCFKKALFKQKPGVTWTEKGIQIFKSQNTNLAAAEHFEATFYKTKVCHCKIILIVEKNKV